MMSMSPEAQQAYEWIAGQKCGGDAYLFSGGNHPASCSRGCNGTGLRFPELWKEIPILRGLPEGYLGRMLKPAEMGMLVRQEGFRSLILAQDSDHNPGFIARWQDVNGNYHTAFNAVPEEALIFALEKALKEEGITQRPQR